MNDPQRVLIVEDDVAIHKLVKARLKGLKIELICIEDGLTGLAAAQEQLPNLILLDIRLPGVGGYEICRQLKRDPLTREIPVIFMTGLSDPTDVIKGFKLGAVDYVTKPFNAFELRARVESALKVQALMAELESPTRSDALTSLPNRQAFLDALDRCLERCREDGDNRFCVLFLDLDRFKIINGSLGHAAGDHLLTLVADKLQSALRTVDRPDSDRTRDLIARLGGDEFAVLLDQVCDRSTAVGIVKRIHGELSQIYVLGEYEAAAQASIGITFCDGLYTSADTVLRDGDIALSHAKANADLDRYAIFDRRMYDDVLARLQREQDLRRALDRRELVLHYQPVVSLQTGRLHGFEALIRWQHPTSGVIVPNDFIPIAEETGLIMEIGRWVISEACRQLSQWQRQMNRRRLYLGVNLARRQLLEATLAADIRSEMEQYEIDTDTLVLEANESVLLHDLPKLVSRFKQLRAQGAMIALDDFGAGAFSLATLHRLSIDVVKIDPSSIGQICHSRAYANVMQSVIALAHDLNLRVVAEGVETGEQLAQLQALDCDLAQGFYFSHPLCAQNALPFLEPDFCFADQCDMGWNQSRSA